jgi:hypothetical protein
MRERHLVLRVLEWVICLKLALVLHHVRSLLYNGVEEREGGLRTWDEVRAHCVVSILTILNNVGCSLAVSFL